MTTCPMIYPLISEYAEAILLAEDNFKELTHLRPVLDEEGHPIMSSGNFAVVFKMLDTNTGKYYAIKCFTRNQVNRSEAYKEISDYISKIYSSDYLISVQYLENELYVASGQTDDTEFPILLMDWVEGSGLEEYILKNIDDEERLTTLYEKFGEFVNWLLPSRLSHGDLKPDNIIITPKNEIVLIDYDGMFVPSMIGQRSPELGTPQFQYEHRKNTDFNEFIDDYAAIYLLLILKLITIERHPFSFYLKMDKETLITHSSKYINDVSISKLLSSYLLVNSLGFIERELLANTLFDECKRNRNLELRLISEAMSGDTQAMIKLGDTYSRGKYTPVNPCRALEWYMMAKLSGDINAACGVCRHYYRHLYDNYFGVKDECNNPIHHAMLQNSVDLALCREAEAYVLFKKGPKDDGLRYWEKAEALNFAPAIKWLFLEQSDKTDLSKLYKAASLNYSRAYCYLGDYYRKGEHVPQNLKEALKHYQNAANFGDEEAQYIIGRAYYYGWEDYSRDLSEAIKWLTKSAEQGYTKAVSALCRCYVKGKGVERDLNKAFSLILPHHDCSDSDILLLLGACYKNGYGTKQDYGLAIKYFTRSIHCWGGNSLAEINLDGLLMGKGLTDETTVNQSELPNVPGETNTGLYSPDGKRFLVYYGTYGEEYSVFEGAEVLCDDSFNDLYCESDGHYLEKLTLPESLKRIGNNVFCASIREIECKSKHFIVRDGFLLSKDGKILYRYFGDSKEVHIPNTVVYIKGGAFSEKEITKIYIPDSVKCMGDNPFAGINLRFYYSSRDDNPFDIINESKYFLIEDKTLYSLEDERLVAYFGDERHVKIRKSTKIIGKNAFWQSNLQSLDLYGVPLKKVDDMEFIRCSHLDSIDIRPNDANISYILPSHVREHIIVSYRDDADFRWLRDKHPLP